MSDPEKRKQYDMFGSDEERMATHHHQHPSDTFSRGFESDATAEELFNMFFGGGFPSGQNVYVRRGGRWHRQTESHHRHREVSPQYTTTNLNSISVTKKYRKG